jgi:hypothetical protein
VEYDEPQGAIYGKVLHRKNTRDVAERLEEIGGVVLGNYLLLGLVGLRGSPPHLPGRSLRGKGAIPVHEGRWIRELQPSTFLLENALSA